MKERSLAELVSDAIEKRGKSFEEIAAGGGFSSEYLRRAAKGLRVPGDAIAMKMAEALGIDKITMLRAAHKARGETGWREIESILAPEKKTLPSFGHIVAGNPVEAIRESEGEYQVLPEQWGPNRYVLTVSGDSMYPELKEGDRIVVENTPEDTDPRRYHGKVCTILLNGGSMLKRVFMEKKGNKLSVQLKPDNPYLPAYVVREEDDFKIQGIVVGVVWRRL